MSRRSTLSVGKRSLQKQEQSLDQMPHKSVKKHKAKERQFGRKETSEYKKRSNETAIRKERA